MYTLDVCNLDSAPSVPRRWPSMKKRRIENEKKRGTRKKTRRRTKRRRNAEGEKVDASLGSRLLDVPGGKEGELRMEEERYGWREREGRQRLKSVRAWRQGGNTIQPGQISEAVEGDIPDSCRRARIILGPLLARGPEKTTPLIGIKSTVRLYASRRRDAEKARTFYLRVSCDSPPARSMISFSTEIERERDRRFSTLNTAGQVGRF